MGLRIAEIDQDTVAHVLGDKAVKPGDGLGDRAVVVADQLAQILRVMTGRERGRVLPAKLPKRLSGATRAVTSAASPPQSDGVSGHR
jgi:hypothetical protein